MGNYYLLRDGLISDTSTYGMSIPGFEKTNNTTAYTLSDSDSWSILLSAGTTDVIDSIAVHLSGIANPPLGTLTLEVSSRTVSPTTVGTYPISSFTSYDGSNNTINSYPLNWQLLKLSSPFLVSTGAFKLNLKTSNTNQLTLIGLNTAGGINYDVIGTLSGNNALRPITKSATLSAITPFTNGTELSSIYFNGTSTYCLIPYNSNLDLSTDDFCVEGWIYAVSKASTTPTIFRNNNTNSASLMLALWYDQTTNKYTVVTNNGGLYHSTASIVYNQWTHFAITRQSGTMSFYINGVRDFSVSYTTSIVSNGSDWSLGVANNGSFGTYGWKGYVSNFRVVKGNPVYTGASFTVPISPLETIAGAVYSTKVLYKSPYSTYYSYNVDSDNIHIGGSNNNYSTEFRTPTASIGTVGNVYIHKNGLLKFSDTSSTSLSVIGTNGIQITSEGTLNIGTSSNPVPANITHQVVLSSNSIGVHNGGNLNVYGAYKLPYASFDQPYDGNSRTSYGTVEDISSWSAGDFIVFTPSTSNTTTDVYQVNLIFSSNSFGILGTSFIPRSLLSYVPNVANLTRNVKIKGLSTTAKGSIRAKGDAAISNLNNVEFSYINSAVLSAGNGSNGSIILSGCTLSGTNTETLISTYAGNLINSNINSNVLYKPQNGISLNGVVSSQNNTIYNNLTVSASNAGIYIDNGSSSNLTLLNNINTSSTYGTYIRNSNVSTNLSGSVNYSNTYGTYVNNVSGTINNVKNTYNTTNGVYVSAALGLSNTTFTNITASNNKAVGFNITGNPINSLLPITLNINGLVANNNLSGGFEGYAITGNLSSLELNGNDIYGMKTSIGNATTTIDGITALMNNNATTSAAIGVLAGLSYYPITIKNANVGKDTNTNTRGAGISLDSTNFSQFYVENSTVSGGASDFQLKTTNNILEGSYMISNTKVGTLPVGVGVTRSNYQSDVLKTTGFAFTNMNNISGYHVTYLAAGNRSIDSTVYINAASSPSERLTPQSTTLKLRSGSKFVALNAGESTTVNVYIRKSTVDTNGVAYNGTAPRLILKRNVAMGIDSDRVIDQLDTTSENFIKLFGSTPTVTDSGVLEFYVDCDGTSGWINIDNWAAN